MKDCIVSLFFFQAEDGIRDLTVTGVQTCALPIFQPRVNGVSILLPTQGATWFKDFVADASGNISGTIYSTRDITGNSNGEIECPRSEEHTSELQSQSNLVCRLLLEKKKIRRSTLT